MAKTELTAGELWKRLVVLQHDGISVPEYEQITSKLLEFDREMGDRKLSIDAWCERLEELRLCRENLE